MNTTIYTCPCLDGQGQVDELFLLIKMIACNLQNWFRQAILPEEECRHRVTTLRRTIYRTCGVIVGKEFTFDRD